MKPAFNPHACNPPLRSHAPRKQQGLGMLEVLLFIAVLSGLAVAGYLEWRSRETIKTALEERQSLSQADSALITFATVNLRLPCPDTNRDGLEDCGGAVQKGWLPSITLQLAGADPGVSTGQLRYLVQRGATAYDLANPVVADDWRPLEYDDGVLPFPLVGGLPATFNAMRPTTASGGAYQADILTLADFCQRLEMGAGTALAAGMAQVHSSPLRPVAYALVHPGIADADGNNSLFDGLNATSTGNTVEDPNKAPLLASYDDRVLERSFDSLYTAFDCQPLFQSINTVALGLDVVDQVEEMRKDSIAAAERAVIFAALGTAVTAVELSASIIEAISDTGNAVAEGVLCGATLGLAVNACAATGIHVGAAVSAGLATGFTTATIVLNSAAAVAAGNALALADKTKSAADLTASCPSVDVSDSLAKALKELNEAVANKAALQAELTAKEAELAPSIAARTAAYNFVLSGIRGFGRGTSSERDSDNTNLYNAAANWYTRNQTALLTAAKVDNYASGITTAASQVADYDYQIANRATAIAALESEIATLDAQIAAAPEGQAKEDLKLARVKALGKLGLLNDTTALQQARARAASDLATAQSDYVASVTANNLAQTAIGTARTSYSNWYSALNNATLGPYTIFQSNLGSIYYPSFRACTEQWPGRCGATTPNQVDTHGAIMDRVWDLYGVARPLGNNGSYQPQEDSKFLRPEKIQKEVDALKTQVADAEERIVKSRALYDGVLAQFNNPPACNITGTGVTPWSPTSAADLLLNVDTKGGTR